MPIYNWLDSFNCSLLVQSLCVVNLRDRCRKIDFILTDAAARVVRTEMRLALHIGVNRRYNGVPADEVEPALSFHRQLQSALHAYGLAGIVLCPACCRIFAYKITCLVRVEVDRTVTGIYGAGCLSAYLIDDAACVVEILVQFYFSLSLQKKDVCITDENEVRRTCPRGIL